MNFNNRVILNEVRLNSSDNQIIDYIKNNTEKFVNQSIQKTAKELYTVPNTLVRLSKKLGYSGFSELKFSLKYDTSMQKSDKKITNIIESLDIVYKIEKTIDTIDYEILNKIVEKLIKAKKIILLGKEGCKDFIEIFAKNIRYGGKEVDVFYNKNDILYNIENSTLKDNCVLISISENRNDVIDIIKNIKMQGAEIINITDLSEEDLSKLSNLNLFFYRI